MKRVLILAALLFMLSASALWAADVYVNPYVRSDGTQVQGHYRSAPDANPYNNFSTRGNVNPYTGERGHVDPYRQDHLNTYPSNSDRSHYGTSPLRGW